MKQWPSHSAGLPLIVRASLVQPLYDGSETALHKQPADQSEHDGAD